MRIDNRDPDRLDYVKVRREGYTTWVAVCTDTGEHEAEIFNDDLPELIEALIDIYGEYKKQEVNDINRMVGGLDGID